MTTEAVLHPPQDLVDLSHALGSPEYAILGDGNTSCHGSIGTFWVKASGTSLSTVRASDLVQCRFAPILEMLAGNSRSDQQIKDELVASKVNGEPSPLPSIETVMHAALLSYEGVNYVGHTHPTTINMLTCSKTFEEGLKGRVFPEEVVICGPESVLVPYADPGLPLAREIKMRVDEYISRWRVPPRTIYLRNHGFIALGASAREVRNVTMMATKAAKIRIGAISVGGLVLMTDDAVARIAGRPDVHYRQRILGRG